MEVKYFICAGLLKPGDTFENKVLQTKEVLTPTVKNFITKEWLTKIHPGLPKHIRDTRGHLFTTHRPTLACNQKVLAEQMPTLLKELNGQSDLSQGSVSVGHAPSMGMIRGRGRGQVRSNGGRGLMRGAGAFRPTRPQATRPPMRESGCFRCLEATPRRYDAAQTHLVRDCQWPPNPAPGMVRQYHQQQTQPRGSQPNFRVVLFPENNMTSQPQMATVSMATQEGEGQQYYDDGQFYDNSHYQEAEIVELSQDEYGYHVDSVDNKDILYYEPALSIQSIKCTLGKISIQTIPTRKVQTIASEMQGQVLQLTIDSGSEADCIRLDECDRLGIQVQPLAVKDERVPTQADGHSPLQIVGRAKFVTSRGKVSMDFDGYVATTLNAAI